MRVLVTANFTEEGKRRLQGLGLEVIHDPWSRRHKLLRSDELAEKLVENQAEAVILEVDLCHEEVFEACDLKFIGCCRGDPLVVDLDEATARKVPVFFTPGRNADAVADLCLCFMLCHLRRVIPIATLLSTGKFDPGTPEEYMRMFRDWTGYELCGQTVGIVGLGAVGSAVARRVRAFGSRMLGFDPFAPESRFAELGVETAGMEEVFRNSDVVTLHAADLDENMGMITRELIRSMKPEALFLNLARAALVDNDALYEALRDRRIAAAGLDVFEDEPPSKDDRFLKLDNVIAMPHLGGATHDVVRHQTEMMVADLEAYFAGRPPRHCANPEALSKKP